uniref:GDNF-inducible zinc finger protein 1 n=1 Tax=Catharus ustulatus TaxID=91951 RepID=A0A8C3TK59_CATUS
PGVRGAPKGARIGLLSQMGISKGAHLGIQEEFLAHKAVLAASSNYFRGLFLHQEMLDAPKCTVTLQDIYTEEFNSFLEFVYTAEVEIEVGKLQRMKEIAERLECKDLLDICEEVKVEDRKGLDLNLHLKGQRDENGGSQWPPVQQEENPRSSSQIMAMPMQRRLWNRQKHKELLPGYELTGGQAGAVKQEATDFPAPKSRPAKPPKMDSRSRPGVASLQNKDGPRKKSTRVMHCDKCQEQFVSWQKYVAHCRDVHQSLPGKAYRCEECGKAFASYTSCKEHRACVHSDERRFSCPLCQATFKRKRDVKTHIMRKHEGRIKRPLCSMCGKILSSPTYLKCHKRCHLGAKPYKCEQCGKAFTQQGALRRHQRIHTGEKPYKCSACGRAFTDMSTLRRHVVVGHSHGIFPLPAPCQRHWQQEFPALGRGWG